MTISRLLFAFAMSAVLTAACSGGGSGEEDGDVDGDVDVVADGDADAADDGIADGDADDEIELRPPFIDSGAVLPEHPESQNCRFVNFRPGDGETVHLNPPRFSWRYGAHDWVGGLHTFTLEIGGTPDLASPIVSVETPYNFYNTLPVLEGSETWYWRVGYDVGTADETWSDTRSFTVAGDAVAWDRSGLAAPDLEAMGHPRILLSPDSIDAIRALMDTNPASQEAAADMRADADDVLASSWWSDFPATDVDPAPEPYHAIAGDLALVAFVWLITQDPAYEGVVDRAVTFASWPRGGYSSPEGAGGDSAEDSTQANEYLALLFDWLYPELTEGQRQTFITSLEWRADYIINEFAWKRDGNVRTSGISTQCSSHPFEASMDTAPIGLALYEHSPMGRECFDLYVNYMIGVSNGFGFEEAWNEGPGYGNSKMKWLMNASLYYATALPDARFDLNPFYRSIGNFFSRVTPVGLPHSPWGNGSAGESYYRGGRVANFRKLAFLTGEGRFLANWHESGGDVYSSSRPWIEYVLPHYYAEPAEFFEEDPVHLFQIAGWVTAASQPPSSAAGFDEGVGIIFQSRCRGGYSHSFNSDNAFQIHAYGQQINHGGGSTVNLDAYAYHTMSHTTVMVDGLGQAQPGGGPMLHPTYARVAAFQRGDDYVYFAGDATNAYPSEPGDYSRWGLPLDSVYEERGLGHLQRFVRHILFMRDRYFVIFDDLETAADSPATFTWLYHILPADPFSFSADDFTVDYAVEDVQVKLVHVANRGGMTLDDRSGLEEMVNPFTGEDYRDLRQEGPECGHNLWISNDAPASQFHFLVVIYPYRAADPEPVITRIDEFTVSVESGPGALDVIYFGSEPPEDATVTVDYRDIAAACCG